MLDYIKNNYKTLIIALGYIVIATVVYSVLADFIWNLWYVTLIAAVVVFLLGVVIAIFYIKLIKKEEKQKEAKVEVKEEIN